MAVFRHRLLDCGCPGRGLPRWKYALPLDAPSAVQLDPLHRLWLCVTDYYSSAASISYGSYDRDGILSLAGKAAVGIPAAYQENVLGLIIDPSLRCWFTPSTASGNRLYYGTYNDATGEPTRTGYITLPSEKSQSMAIDPVRRLWWKCGHTIPGLYYGTYNEAGVPTYVGTYIAQNALGIGVDPTRGLLWVSGSAGDIVHGAYNPTTGEPALTGAPTTNGVRTQFGVDPVRRWMWGAEDGNATRMYAYGQDGVPTLVHEVEQPVPAAQLNFSVDPELALVAAAGYGGDNLVVGSYCQL